MKIAVNARIHQAPPSGIPLYVEQLYRTVLAAGEHEVTFLQSERVNVIDEPTVVSRFAAPAPLFDLHLAARMARRQRPAVFHGPSHILPPRLPRSIRAVVTIHDLSFVTLPQGSNNSRLFDAYYRPAVRWSVDRADAVIADSRHTKQDVVDAYGISPERVVVVPIGVSPDFAAASSLERTRDRPYFLSLSTHPRRKNILRALDAFSRVARDVPGIDYIIAGQLSDAHLQELRHHLEGLGLADRVHLLGFVSRTELLALLGHAEWLLYPSLYEGFGLPVLEAMSAGCPVIAGDTSSIPELILDDGILVDPLDTDSIADGIVKMHAMSRSARVAMVDRARARAATYTWERTAAETLAVLGQV